MEAQDPNFGDWHVTRRSVHLHPEKLYLSLSSSKTDPFRRGITLTTAATSDDACAVSSLQNIFFCFPLPPTAPLFKLTTTLSPASTLPRPSGQACADWG